MVWDYIEINKDFSRLDWIVTETCDMLCCLKGGLIMGILKQLYNGELYPAENNVPDTEEYHKATRETDCIEKKFTADLTEEQHELFEQYMSATAKVDKLIQEEVFRQGFVMGATMREEIDL